MMRSPDAFDAWMANVRTRSSLVNGPLFLTDVRGKLWGRYLRSFHSKARRQIHNCAACRLFVQRYASLAIVADDGHLMPLFWGSGGVREYRDQDILFSEAVRGAKITGPFLDRSESWGYPVSGGWSHFHSPGRPTPPISALLTDDQWMAEKRQDHAMLLRAFDAFSPKVVAVALEVLRSDTLYRGEKVLGVAEWFAGLRRGNPNLLWRAVSEAPPGYCHVRSTMIGTLLEDIQNDVSLETAKRRFAEKMHPLQYQRPTAPPSRGQLDQAEKTFRVLEATGALPRVFAGIGDLEPIWTPTPTPRTPSGAFSHLRRPAFTSTRSQDGGVMTWEKFTRTVLPRAEKLELLIDGRRQIFGAFVTAVDRFAPVLNQWENHVSWYLYHGGSYPQTWNLAPRSWATVNAIAEHPAHWRGQQRHAQHGEQVMLVLEGARDTSYVRSGGSFPENMRSEYHGIRRTLEAYYQDHAIADAAGATACGLLIQKKGGTFDHVLRVTSGGVQTMLKIDRWD